MKKTLSISEAIQHLHAKGYQLAETHTATLPKEAIQSDDWRLDSIQQIPPGQDKRHKTLVIAVSSMRRRLKLIFVESMPKSDFTPMTLLRQLFPMPQRPGVSVQPQAV